MRSIYDYTSYRSYLSDYFEERKKNLKSFSHKYFSLKAGIKSTGFIHLVMSGKRNMTPPVTLKVAKALRFGARETAYFQDLVLYDQAKTHREKQLYHDRIFNRRKEVNIRNVRDSQYVFYSHWYYSVLRELVSIIADNTNADKMSELLIPKVPPGKVKRALKAMEEVGILKKTGRVYRQTAPFIGAGSSVRDMNIVKFQKDMLEQALQAWERFSSDEMSMSTMTFSMPESMVEEIREEMRKFKRKIFTLLRDTQGVSPERVYHINFNLFPVSKSGKSRRK